VIEPELEPMPADLADLLDAERVVGYPPVPEALARQIAAEVAAGVGGAAASTAVSATSASAAGSTGASGLAASIKGAIATKIALASALSFMVGSGTGAVLHATLSKPRAPAPIVARQEVVATPPPSATEPVTAEPAPVPAPAPSPGLGPRMPAAPLRATPPQVPEQKKAVPSAHDIALADERGLLEMARTALARGQSDAALEALEGHARRFPQGQLVEEREGLAILALAAAGRGEEARRRSASFQAKYPNSLLLLAIEAALQPRDR